MYVNQAIIRIWSISVVAVLMSSCGGSYDLKSATDLCDAISQPNANFVSYKQKLNGSSRYAHEWAQFNSQARFYFNDSEDAGTYECLNQNTVLFTNSETGTTEELTFAENFESFIVVREGDADPTKYIRALPEVGVDLCAIVENGYYVEDDVADFTNEDFKFLNFGDDETVAYRLYGTSDQNGTYDCSGNELHIHNAKGGSIRVGTIHLREQGSGLYLLTANQSRINLIEADPKVLAPVCEALEGTTFYSQDLVGNDGLAEHLPVMFENERITFTEGDAVFQSAYACKNGVVTLNRGPSGMPATLEFEEDISQFIERNENDEVMAVYRKAPSKPNTDCDSVAGATYSEVIPITQFMEQKEASNVAVATSPMHFTFVDDDNVDFDLGHGFVYNGTYDCALETLHVHYESSGELAAELHLSNDKTSIDVTVVGGNAVTTLHKEDPDTCYQYDGLTYLASHLTDDFGVLRHPWVEFYDGKVEFVQEGLSAPEPYKCNLETPLEISIGETGGYAMFSADFNQIEVVRFPSNPVTETYYRASDEFKADCELVDGKYYSATSANLAQAENSAEGSNNLMADPAPPPYIYFTTSDVGARAEFFLSNISGSGHYDCELDKLHIHTNGQGAEVMDVEVNEDGSIIEVNMDSETLSFYTL